MGALRASSEQQAIGNVEPLRAVWVTSTWKKITPFYTDTLVVRTFARKSILRFQLVYAIGILVIDLSTILLFLISILISNYDLVEIGTRVFPLPKTVKLSVITRQNSRDVLSDCLATVLNCVPETANLQKIFALNLADPMTMKIRIKRFG